MASRIRIGIALFALAGVVNIWWWWDVLHRGDWLWWSLFGMWCGWSCLSLYLLTIDLARLAERGPKISDFFPACPDASQPRKGGGAIEMRN